MSAYSKYSLTIFAVNFYRPRNEKAVSDPRMNPSSPSLLSSPVNPPLLQPTNYPCTSGGTESEGIKVSLNFVIREEMTRRAGRNGGTSPLPAPSSPSSLFHKTCFHYTLISLIFLSIRIGIICCIVLCPFFVLYCFDIRLLGSFCALLFLGELER